MTTWLRRLVAVAPAGLAVLHLAGCGAANADASPTGDSRDQRLSVPVTDSFGKTTRLQARLCRPLSDAPARLVVINHGSPPSSTARPQMQLGRCSGEACAESRVMNTDGHPKRVADLVVSKLISGVEAYAGSAAGLRDDIALLVGVVTAS